MSEGAFSSSPLSQAKQAWLKLDLPACLDSLLSIQAVLTEFAARQGFPMEQRFKLELALEELITTVLRFSLDEAEADSRIFRLEIRLDDGFLKACLTSRGMPFNWSMIPEYDPRKTSENLLETPSEEGLSAFLLKQVVDRYQLSNLGKEGVSIELAWRLAGGHIAAMEPEARGSQPVVDSAAADEPLSPVRRLAPSEEIQVSRLVYRSYGYTYVDETLYYPEGIRESIVAGTLDSWVIASESSGELVGHIALMRTKPQAPLVEWGMAVVSPNYRGRGLMKTMVSHLMSVLTESNVQAAFAHAVAVHPFTQKTAVEFGFQPTALQLGFAPAIKFKQLDESAQHRESTYICMRFFKPVTETVVYLPAWHQAWLKALMDGFEGLQLGEIQIVGEQGETAFDVLDTSMPLSEQAALRKKAHQSVLTDVPAFVQKKQAWPNSQLSSQLNANLNIAQIEVQQIGRNLATLLNRELYRLSSEQVDVIYLHINLANPLAPRAVAIGESLGFFVSGWLPLSPWPMTLTLQYLNKSDIEPTNVTSASRPFDHLKNRVFSERALIECLVFSQFEPQTEETGQNALS